MATTTTTTSTNVLTNVLTNLTNLEEALTECLNCSGAWKLMTAKVSGNNYYRCFRCGTYCPIKLGTAFDPDTDKMTTETDYKNANIAHGATKPTFAPRIPDNKKQEVFEAELKKNNDTLDKLLVMVQNLHARGDARIESANKLVDNLAKLLEAQEFKVIENRDSSPAPAQTEPVKKEDIKEIDRKKEGRKKI